MSIDLRNGDCKKLIFQLAVPAMLAQFVNVLYNIVDRLFISNMPVVGTTALAGIGICVPILTVISACTYLASLGGAPLLAMALGREDPDDAQNIFSTSIAMMMIISITIMLFFLTFLDPLLLLFGASEVLLPYSHAYMVIYVGGAFIGIFALGLNAFISAQGYSRQAMISVTLGAITNIIFDYVFIYIFDWGVSGAAAATVLGQSVSLVYAISFFLGKNTAVRLGVKFDVNRMKRIVKIGFSPFMINSTDGVIIIFLNSILQRYGGAQGDMYITAATIATATFQIVAMPMAGISSGCQPLLSYNLGAQQFDRVKKSFKYDMAFCFTFCFSMFVIFQLFPEPFAHIFTQDPEMIELSCRCIKIFTFGFVILGFQYAGVDGLTALALPKPALFLSMWRKAICLIAAFGLPAFFGAEAVFYCEPIADIVGSITSFFITTYTVKQLLIHNHYYE